MLVKWKSTTLPELVNWLLVTSIATTTLLVPSANGLSTVDDRGGRKLFGGYRITPKFCRASKTLPQSDPRSKGPTICMFNHECAQRNGEVVGACMDGFLFGACCQIPGEIGNSLLQQAQYHLTSSSAVSSSYNVKDSQGGISYEVVPQEDEDENQTDEFYETTGDDIEIDGNEGQLAFNTIQEDSANQFYVNQNSVVISSPSSLQYQPDSSTQSSISSMNAHNVHEQSHFSSELPAKISTQVFTSSYNQAANVPKPTQSLDFHKNPTIFDGLSGEFSHSDITHPAADSDLIEEESNPSNYGQSTFYLPSSTQQSSTGIVSTTAASVLSSASTFQYNKPAFKPKPTVQSQQTQINDEKYVLVQTITNDKTEFKPPMEGITTGDLESIESIILMLNDTRQGPTYNIDSSSPDPNRLVYSIKPSGKPIATTNSVASDKIGSGGFYITTISPSSQISSTANSIIVKRPLLPNQSNNYNDINFSSTFPTTVSRPTQKPRPPSLVFAPSKRPPAYITSTTTTRKPPNSKRPLPVGNPAQNNEVIITPTRRPTSTRPTKTPQPPTYSYVAVPTKPINIKRPGVGTKTPKPPSTSYVTGSTTQRPKPTKIGNRPQEGVYSSTSVTLGESSYGSSSFYGSSTQQVPEQKPTRPRPQRPEFVKIPPTLRPPSPTVIITPKPTVITVPGGSTWTKVSTEGIESVHVSSERPDPSSAGYLGVPTVVSNDFDDHGYYDGEGIMTKPPLYNVGSTGFLPSTVSGDDKFVYPGHFSQTPSYSTFNLPIAEEVDSVEEEETYTSPNDFVNFPPVRNPNLNMSATSSAVTYDIDVSTPGFVEDDALKDKMNLLVNKIVQSLQGNFDVLADIVDERNASFSQQDADRTTVRPQTPNRKPTPSRNPSTRPPTRRPTPNKTPSRPPGTRKPTQTTKKPVGSRKPTVKPSQGTKRPTQATRRPSKPTRKVSTTTTEAIEDEIEAEEDVEDNEIDADVAEEGSRRLQCGVRPHMKTGRIVGGKASTFGEWPWQVLVRESTWLGLFTKNKCGGVLITNKFVVTAAHCQPGFLASLVAVFGEFDISGDLESKRSVTKNVKRVIVHRQYDAATFENDLALLELESAIHYDTHIVPICMPSEGADFTGRMATVTGWGRLKYDGGVPSVLQEVQVPIIENTVCQEMFHTAGHKKKILSSFLCAGYANGQKDSCEGDSGGPLVLQRDDGRWELAGTVSHGIRCAAPYLPGVYMRTTYYKPWLKSITGVK